MKVSRSVNENENKALEYKFSETNIYETNPSWIDKFVCGNWL